MPAVVGFFVSFNYNSYESGILYPIEGCFVDQFTKESTIMTFDNSFRKQSRHDSQWNYNHNRRFTGLNQGFNGTVSLNSFRASLMRSHYEMKKKLGMNEKDVLIILCASYSDEEVLLATRLPILNLKKIGFPDYETVVNETNVHEVIDTHTFAHKGRLSHNCVRKIALTYTQYLKEKPLLA